MAAEPSFQVKYVDNLKAYLVLGGRHFNTIIEYCNSFYHLSSLRTHNYKQTTAQLTAPGSRLHAMQCYQYLPFTATLSRGRISNLL